MAYSIQSVTDMVSYAGDLRRSARHEQPELATKIRQAAAALEETAFTRLSLPGSRIGKLLDTLT